MQTSRRQILAFSLFLLPLGAIGAGCASEPRVALDAYLEPIEGEGGRELAEVLRGQLGLNPSSQAPLKLSVTLNLVEAGSGIDLEDGASRFRLAANAELRLIDAGDEVIAEVREGATSLYAQPDSVIGAQMARTDALNGLMQVLGTRLSASLVAQFDEAG